LDKNYEKGKIRMVKEIVLLPEFTPGFVEIKNKIPKFQYRKLLGEELREENLTKVFFVKVDPIVRTRNWLP